jgi:DHA1 family bicyclomycin/chloramphenicol resistance-like MFS transporter
VFRNRQTVGYMLASTAITACLFGYITCSEQLFVDTFKLGTLFPLAFGSVAIAISVGTFLNARLVLRRGMRGISHTMLALFVLIGLLHWAVVTLFGASFWLFLVLLSLNFSVFGMIGANFNALAMEPMARNAGAASAMFGAVTSAGGALGGGLIARGYDGTVTPFLVGVVVTGALSAGFVLWTERGKLFQDPPTSDV